MWKVLDHLIQDESPSQTAAARTSHLKKMHDLMDTRIGVLEPFASSSCYMPNFPAGFYSKLRIEAWQFLSWISLIPFAITEGNTVLKHRATRVKFLTILGHLRSIVRYMWSSEMGLSDADLDTLSISIGMPVIICPAIQSTCFHRVVPI